MWHRPPASISFNTASRSSYNASESSSPPSVTFYDREPHPATTLSVTVSCPIGHMSAAGQSRWEIVAHSSSTEHQSNNLRAVLAPLALAQFICSFAGSNMNVMITDMSEDLDTTVQGIQIAITIFLLVMAALMIPGGKLTDRYGRKRCSCLD